MYPKTPGVAARQDDPAGTVLVYSESTGNWGYAPGGRRESVFKALQYCKAADAKVIAQQVDCWMALAFERWQCPPYLTISSDRQGTAALLSSRS
jgi:hypothetical protein